LNRLITSDAPLPRGLPRLAVRPGLGGFLHPLITSDAPLPQGLQRRTLAFGSHHLI
jgi:hypothetical protein